MDPRLLEAAIVAASLGAWFAAYGAALLITRPPPVRAGPGTPDLGTEPPAVAGLIANGWDLTDDAAEATLLDLAARRHLEFRQPANDPLHTTIHLLDPRPARLNAYEQRVFDRVAGLAVNGVVPMTALTFRDDAKAKTWWKRLNAEIVADARKRGLSQRRFRPTTIAILVGLAVPAAIGAALGGLHYAMRSTDEDAGGVPFSLGLFSFIALASFASRSIGEKDTRAGREAAARWLGVRDWLRGHEAFADLPPSAVAVWDRYLAYGAALGTTRLTSAVIEMGMGDRKRVWSSYGGTWHRVHVKYPGMSGRHGATMLQMIGRLVAAFGIGILLLRFWRPLVDELATIEQVEPYAGPAKTVGTALGLVLVGWAGYTLVRLIIDVASPTSVTGQVLWQAVGKTSSTEGDTNDRPMLYYLAIDNGSGDRTTAWIMPYGMAGCTEGDTVTIRVRPWTRRVLSLTVNDHGTAAHRLVEPPEEKTEALIAAAMGIPAEASTHRPPGVAAGHLLTAEEVSRALGLPASTANQLTPDAGVPVRMAEFRGPDGRTVLHVLVARGLPATLAMRARKSLPSLPGVGEEAYAGEGVAVARQGDTVVMLRPKGDANANPENLRWLLSQAMSRLPATVG